MSTTRIPLHLVEGRKKSLKDQLTLSCAEIGLSVRTTNCLEERGIFTVGDLLNCTRDDLLSIANFGEKTLEEVYRALEKVGFYRYSRQAALSGQAVVEPVDDSPEDDSPEAVSEPAVLEAK